MAIFSSAARQSNAHLHTAGEHCPWCEQPIPHGKFEEITRRIQAREREQYESMQLRLTAEFAQKTAALEAKAQATVAEAAAARRAARAGRAQRGQAGRRGCRAGSHVGGSVAPGAGRAGAGRRSKSRWQRCRRGRRRRSMHA